MKYPQFLSDLLALPNLFKSEIRIGDNQLCLLNYAVVTNNHNLLKNLLHPGQGLNALADQRNPIQLAREQAPECLPSLLEHLVKRPLKEQEELLSPWAQDVLTYVYDHHRPLLNAFKAIQSQLGQEQQRKLDELLRKSQLQKQLFAFLSSPWDERAFEKLLEDEAVDVQMKDEQGLTLIQHATWNKNSNLLKGLLNHKADSNQAVDIICSKELDYLELFFECRKAFEGSYSLTDRVIHHFKEQWLTVVTNATNLEALERILTVFPQWIHEKEFQGNKTALEYLIQVRSKYKKYSADKLIILLLSKDPRVIESGLMLDDVAKLDGHEELMLALLKLAVCLPLEQQGMALGTFSAKYVNVFEFTLDKYPQFLNTLDSLHNARMPAVRVDKNLQLLEAIEQGNLIEVQKLIDIGADVNRVRQDKSYPLKQAVYKGDKDMVELLLKNKARFKNPQADEENLLDFAIKNPRCKALLPLMFKEIAGYAKASRGLFFQKLESTKGRRSLQKFIFQHYPDMLPAIVMDPNLLSDTKDKKRQKYKDKLVQKALIPGGEALMQSLLTESCETWSFVDKKSKNTLLMMAMDHDAEAVVKQILAHPKINFLARNKDNQNAFDYAKTKHPKYLQTLWSGALLAPRELQQELLASLGSNHDSLLVHIQQECRADLPTDFITSLVVTAEGPSLNQGAPMTQSEEKMHSVNTNRNSFYGNIHAKPEIISNVISFEYN